MIMDMNIKTQIEQDICRIEELLRTEIFNTDNISNPLRRSAFTEMFIHLADLLKKCEIYSSRISFTDDVIITPEVKDITDLVINVRNALCHISSNNHMIKNTNLVITNNVVRGKGILFKSGDIVVASDYDDDICYCFGNLKLYFKRHIIRAFREAKQELLPLISHDRTRR